MPFKNPEEQKRARRESARRQRAAARGTVEPAVTVPAPTPQMLREAGLVLNVGRAEGEQDGTYRERLRAAWRALLVVVADDSAHRDP